MLVYRICLTRYAGQLAASGRPARWNPADTYVIYTAANRSLACLENVVHRNSAGLSSMFTVLTINIPNALQLTTVNDKQLPAQWNAFNNMALTQDIGRQWLAEGKTAVLKVPSAIIPGEYNYLLNAQHPAFGSITIIGSEPFVFDSRIKS